MKDDPKILTMIPGGDSDRMEEIIDQACQDLMDAEPDQFIIVYRNKERVGLLVNDQARYIENMGLLSMG